MQLILLCLIFATLGLTFGEVILKQGQIEKVTFYGDELQVRVDNTRGKDGLVIICYGAKPEYAAEFCPQGFASTVFLFAGDPKVKTLALGRNGKVLRNSDLQNTLPLLFNKDGSLSVTIGKVPDTTTIVALSNAEIYVPTTMMMTTMNTTELAERISKASVIGISVGAGVAALVIVVIAVTIWLCWYCKNQNSKNSIPPPQAVVIRVPVTPGRGDPTSPITGDKTTSARSPMVEDGPALTPTSSEVIPSTPKSVLATSPSVEPLKPSAENDAEVNFDEPLKLPKQKSKALNVEKSQPETSPSKRSDPATPVLETANNDFRKVSYKKADDIKQYQLLSEDIISYGLRYGKFSRRSHFVLRRQFKCRPHIVSPMEKAILKSTPSAAVEAADVLVEHAKRELEILGFKPKLQFEQPPSLWKHLNEPETETSILYCMLIKLEPDFFIVKREGIHDNEVEVMPVAMVYAMILNRKLSRRFREKLVLLLRKRSLDVIQQAPRESLRNSAFPLHYLVLLHQKNPDGFIDGKSVHSRGVA
uniref:RNA-directed RNA polymerase n=1 Tax=Panagrellus redivivus TaxID=6233 RepID=A0A7E4WA63_PANRE